MLTSGWKQLLEGAPWFRGEGQYPIAAYSEFMPPPRLGPKPYGGLHNNLFEERDPFGWTVTEYEEALELRPGLQHLARILVGVVTHLGRGEAAHGISRAKLTDNPYWPPELAKRAGKLAHERFVILAPLALSRTQDDKGRLRWTLFGGSEQGPGGAFWKGFFTAPNRELPRDQALGFFRRLLSHVYGESIHEDSDLGKVGFRILAQSRDSKFDQPIPYWNHAVLPKWTDDFLWNDRQSLRGVRYLLTFLPFSCLPAPVRKAYFSGDLHLLPFPGSLVFWGAKPYAGLQRELPLAMQLPLLHSVPRHESPFGIRVPQSGLLHEPKPDDPSAPEHHGPMRNTYKRTHRWARVHRDEDELAIEAREEKVLHVLFSTNPDDVGLYNKPMARNAQLWSGDFHLVLDGPGATRADIKNAEHAVLAGGVFGYRFQFPAMRVGLHEVYWHRILAAFLCPQTGHAKLIPDAPRGFLTAYPADHPDPAHPVVLWPRLLNRERHASAIHLFEHASDHRPYQTIRNIRKILDTQAFFGDRPIPYTLARQLLHLPKHQGLDQWLDTLPERACVPELGRDLAADLRTHISGSDSALATPRSSPTTRHSPLTYRRTAKRAFEVAYWTTIAHLAEGRWRNKDNADCVRDSATQAWLTNHHRHHQRDLEALGDYLLAFYRREVTAAGLSGKALVGDIPFQWRTDFDFSWSGGWVQNQENKTEERDLIVVIPGRDRSRAVIMADHYDTAYMEDHYEKSSGGHGARLAAAGADDNHSATAAMMLGAPIFMALSKAGKLACDVWLVHLTGEEFPADCLGARHLCQRLVEGNLKMRLRSGDFHDLSKVRIQGVYVSDMIAHNNDRQRDVFQIAPGTSEASFWLAYQAHLATEAWNASVEGWNSRPPRKGRGRSERSPHGEFIPDVAPHPTLSGQVRLPYDPRSTLYNTDGQIFSDAGVPVVLFMENYDINRTGYHDSHDNMANIDLDYGAALAAIVIESVARATTQKP